MSNVSKLSLNLLTERVYLEGQVHMMYETIINEGSGGIPDSKFIVKKVIQDMKINADFMLTYGLGISAFAEPVIELLHNKNIKITKYDAILLVMTSVYILTSKSKEDLKKLIYGLKKRGLNEELKGVVKFMNASINLFKSIGMKIGVTITTLIDVLSFTFMSVPVLDTLKNIASEKGFSVDNLDELILGFTLSAGSYTLKNLIKKKGLKESEEFNPDDFGWVDEIPELSPCEQFIFDKLLECELVLSKKRPGWTKYVNKNGEILFLENINTGTDKPILYADYYKIWLKCEEMGVSYEEFLKICKHMLYETHERKVSTANLLSRYFNNMLYETRKRKVSTAKFDTLFNRMKLYETHKRKV